MAQTEKPLGPAGLLEQARNLIEREAREMTSTVLLSHAYVIAASICQHLDDLEAALDRIRERLPVDRPAAIYHRDEGSPGEGSRA
jgi:hypothetical protein